VNAPVAESNEVSLPKSGPATPAPGGAGRPGTVGTGATVKLRLGLSASSTYASSRLAAVVVNVVA
jgi:hypothetical protein